MHLPNLPKKSGAVYYVLRLTQINVIDYMLLSNLSSYIYQRC